MMCSSASLYTSCLVLCKLANLQYTSHATFYYKSISLRLLFLTFVINKVDTGSKIQYTSGSHSFCVIMPDLKTKKNNCMITGTVLE